MSVSKISPLWSSFSVSLLSQAKKEKKKPFPLLLPTVAGSQQQQLEKGWREEPKKAMAKRELSSTLKNLKFMQRAVQREVKPKVTEEEEQVIIKEEDGKFDSIATQKKKCIVIMEGNPHPGALKGRMSFQSYNPSIDKLNEAAENDGQAEVPAKNSGDGRTSDRENGVSRPDSDSDGEHKRKLAEVVTETPYPNKSPRNQNGEGDRQAASGSRSKGKKQKHRRPDWNVLRPPKAEKRQS